MQETNYSDQIGRLKQDLEKYAFLISKASQFINNYDDHGTLAHIAARNQLQGEMDTLNHELDLYGARFGNNRLIDLYINQGMDAQIQRKVHDIIVEERLEKWLQNPPNMTAKQHETEKLQMEGTGQWLLASDAFVDWEDNAGVLWIEGSSGTGKSVLSATVIKNLFEEEKRLMAHPPAIAFFYFDFRNKEAQSVEIALRRIVLQLSAQAPHPYETLNKHYQLSNGQKLPSCQDLHSILRRLLHELGRTYIILDALDECNSIDFKQIVALVSVLRAWKETPLHLLFTSQNRDVFTKGFSGVARIVLDVNVTQKDIEFFVSSELQTNSDLEAWQSNATRVTEQITIKSNGMFRLATCLLMELAHYVYPEDADLEQALESLPNDLVGIYDRFMLAIPKNWFLYAEAALRWIMFNEEDWQADLDLSALADAVAFDFSNSKQFTYKPNRQETNKSAIPKWLAGLITVSEKTVTLAHASVQDYLLSGHFKQRFNCDLAENLSHSFISFTCISYLLNFRQLSLEEVTVAMYPLAEYAARHWYYHTMNANDKKNLLNQAIQLLEDDLPYCALSHLIMGWESTVLPPLHFCCRMGYLECVSPLLSSRAGIDLVFENSTPLISAVSWGQKEIAQLLLEKGANVNLIAGKYGSALSEACYYQRQQIVQLLLEKGADANLTGEEDGSPLYIACNQGYQDIAQLLLENGADVKLRGGEHGTALGTACHQGHQDIVQLLLERGTDVNLGGGKYGSALGAACYQGKHNIIQLLLEKGANVNLAGGKYGSALGAAIYLGHQEIVQLLLEKGANVNLAGGNHGSPLCTACYRGEQDIAQLLLEKGADVNLPGGTYGSALGGACHRGQQEIVQILLEKGADVNLGGAEYGGSPLGTACYWGYHDIAQLLLEKGADVNLAGGEYGSALSTAIHLGKEKMVQLLLKSGANVNVADGNHGSPLGAACNGGRIEIVQLLLDAGANVNLTGGSNDSPDSPLSIACSGGKYEIVSLLLEKGANINLQGGHFGSALGAASYCGEQGIVRLLLKNGANVNLTGGSYGSPLGAACYWGRQQIVQLLLDRGANITLEGGEYGSALGAASAEKLEIVSLLLQKGANVNFVGGNYGSPLGVACYHHKQEIVQFLLGKGADINLAGGEYGSALGAASFAGQPEIVCLLLEHGADISLAGGKYGSALAAASAGNWGNNLDTVRFLLKNGADINTQGRKALKEAINVGNDDIAILLQEHGVVLDQGLN
ncbi:ankyrin repeat-containing domain protein [Mycena galopus ATCC 62051]|nr:ankyrin repeat-containing domain protein [Mycena galopus ATCC 62051]